MRIYLAGLSLDILLKYIQIFPDRRLNVLRSFGRPSAENSKYFNNTFRQLVNSLILDSGVYTMNYSKHSNGMKITQSGYIDYILNFGNYFDFYFNFDSNFTMTGYKENWINQKEMEDAGLQPVPVIHNIFSDEADMCIDKGYKLVAIGSMQVVNLYDLYPVIMKLSNAGVRIHLFGTTKFNFLKSFPIYSCDSSTWTQASARGYIYFWNPFKERVDKTDKIHFRKYADEDIRGVTYFNKYDFKDELEAFLFETLGITYKHLIGDDWLFYRRLVNTHYFYELEQMISEEHREKGIITGDEE